MNNVLEAIHELNSITEDEESRYLVYEVDTGLFVGDWKNADSTEAGDVLPSPTGWTSCDLGFVSDNDDAIAFTKAQAEELIRDLTKAYGNEYKMEQYNNFVFWF